MTQLEARDITCGYGKDDVVRGASLDVNAGEVLCLSGPNGSGKTTLLRALARQLPLRSGGITLDGTDVGRFSPAEFSRHVALAPQYERRDWPFAVEAAVLLGRTPHRGWLLPFSQADHDIVHQHLQELGLLSLRARPITELSGGEWRRVILARTLAQQSHVLLFDEPTSGLDLKHRTSFLTQIRQLANERQLAIVFTLLDLNEAIRFCDRLAILSTCRVAAAGTPQEVVTPELIKRIYDVDIRLIDDKAAPLIVTR